MRRERVLAEMKRRGYETAMIWGRGAGGHERGQDTLYLTNYYSSASGQEPDNQLLTGRAFCALILSQTGDPELHVDLPGRRDDLFAIENVTDHYNPIKTWRKSRLWRGPQSNFPASTKHSSATRLAMFYRVGFGIQARRSGGLSKPRPGRH